MARPENCVSRNWLARLWRHECERVYSDRYVAACSPLYLVPRFVGTIGEASFIVTTEVPRKPCSSI